MFKVQDHLSLTNALVEVIHKRKLFKAQTELLGTRIFKLVFDERTSLTVAVVDSIFDERSDDPIDVIKPVTVILTRFALVGKYLELSINYNSREYHFVCCSFSYKI